MTDWYRNVDNTFTFMLRHATFKGHGFHSSASGPASASGTRYEHVKLIAVDMKHM